MRTTLLSVLLFGLPMAQAAQLDTGEYAYIQKLNIEPGHAIYETAIPDALYMSTRKTGIDSVQVLKSSGEPITFSISKAEAQKVETSVIEKLPFFPLTGDKVKSPDEVKIKVIRDDQQFVVDVISKDFTARQRKRHVGYIINLEKLEKQISEINLEWKTAKGSFITAVNIASSDDLLSWKDTGISGVLANMSFDGNSLSRNAIRIGKDTGKFLRISWNLDEYLPEINNVTATFRGHEFQQSRGWHKLATAKAKDEDMYEFELPGWMPVDQIKVLLPEDNSASRMTFESRPDNKAPWRSRGAKLVYHLNLNNKVIADDVVNVTASRDRYWRVNIPGSELAIGEAAPQLMLGWKPERVRFLARGATDYLLALSTRTDISSGRRYDSLLSEINNGNSDDIVPAVATPAEIVRQLSAATEKESLDKDEIKSWVLWLVLLLGVALLGFMAMRLSRQLKRDE